MIKTLISGVYYADKKGAAGIRYIPKAEANKHSLNMGVKMDKICWKDEYSVGVEKIDHQHRHLFEIINKLIERSAASGDSKLVTETLTEMLNYAKEHFTDEEELMQEYGYPEIEQHKEQHIYFFKTTAELSINALNKQSMVCSEIVEFLKLWLTLHILGVDMKYKEFFKAKIPAKV